VNEHMNVARALTQLGRYDEAFPEIDRTIALSESHPMAMAVKGYIEARAGMTEQARDTLRALHAASAKRHVAPYYFAVVHAGLGENDEALDWLEKVYEERHVGVLSLKMEPEFDGLHREPRFKALLKKVGLGR
jgi:tetratricopeptide (TPR) repeat protein